MKNLEHFRGIFCHPFSANEEEAEGPTGAAIPAGTAIDAQTRAPDDDDDDDDDDEDDEAEQGDEGQWWQVQ